MKRNDQYESSAKLAFCGMIGIMMLIILMRFIN